MSEQEELGQRIVAWLKLKQFDRSPVRSPYVNVPDFPDPDLVHLKDVPKLAASVERLNISSELGISVPAIASLISVMNRTDAEKLYNQLSRLSVPANFDDEMACKWFVVCHNLSEKMMIPAVTGFFKLTELQGSEDFHMNLMNSLACWFKVLTAFHKLDYSRTEILFRIAERYPDRFAFVCLRVASGGERIIAALENFLLLTKNSDLCIEESSSILDFTMETGWILERKDFHYLWKLISQKGSLLQGRLCGDLVPMSSIRFLAGILRGLEETVGLEALLAKERTHKAMSLFNSSSEKQIEKSFSLFPELAFLIDRQNELDLVVEVVSHRILENNQSDIGYSIVEFLTKIPGGVSLAKLLRFLGANGGEISGEVVMFLTGLVLETNRKNRLSPSNIIKFSSIVSRVLPVSVLSDRTALRTFHSALAKMDHSQARWAINQLEETAFRNDAVLSSVLAASSLLLRASGENNKREYLSRIEVTSRLLDALLPIDRKKALSGIVPLWVETLFSFSLEAAGTVIEYVYKVNDISNRNRYLENVVTRMLGEVYPEDPVFEDCLAFAVRGYNSSGLIDKLRETELKVFQKVFRAGGRIAMVDSLMMDLLAIPGFEGDKTEQLISGIRSICNRFSRLAVWEEGGDSRFSDFIVEGVSNILRAFVDNTGTLDSVNGEIIGKLLLKLMPDGSNSTNTSGIVNLGGTAQTFFGFILPNSLSLFGREVRSLPDFLFEIADEFSRSVGGMTAGEDFAEYLVTMLDIEIMQDRVAVLGAWLSQKSPPPLNISKKWSNRRREEWNSLRIREDTARMKLYSAVSALTCSSESYIREAILNTAGYLSKQIERAGIPGAARLSLDWSRTMMDQFLALSEGISLFTLFKGEATEEEENQELFSYLESIDGFMEQDVFHAWRQAALSPLLNCAIEIVLVSGNSVEIAREMAETATNAVEFLGYNNANSFLSTLQESFRHATSPENGYALMEKNFLLPLWKRNSAERLDIFMLGMKKSRLMTGILLERLSFEERVEEKVRFMRNYATFFITVEKAILDIQSDIEKSQIADGLMDSWIFSGAGTSMKKPVSEISETAELVQDIFRRIKYGSGIVSAREAGEISADMRRKYRDNADSVAIILRWTVDPAREGLLQLLEESQLLLQAAGADSELMNLLDIHGIREGFLQDAKPYSERPEALKKYLKTLPVMDKRE
ncbi:MAG: hypothetical protein K8S62_08655 [Candidatus Sabulitectum sp.]|nr:hypothetical protein [Candidatus Sabulitectum sp.]